MSEKPEVHGSESLTARSSPETGTRISPSPSETTLSPDPDSGPFRAAKRLLEAGDAEDQEQADSPPYAVPRRVDRYGIPAVRYLLQTEVHTYAFSFAANALLSFFPFYVLLLTVTRRFFHSLDMYNIMLEVIRQYLPSNQDFVIRNLQFLASVHGRGQLLSFVMLLITSTGVFLPLEVALNSVWGFEKNRSYLMNLVVSLGLAFGCGVLALSSVALTARNLKYLDFLTNDPAYAIRSAEYVALKITAIVPAIAIYFLIYWLLPNGRVPIRAVLPAAIIMGLLTEGAKYVFTRVLPWLNFQEVYGPFSISVTMMMWSYVTGMLLLLGAYLSAAKHSDRIKARQMQAADS